MRCQRGFRWYTRIENYVKRHLGIVAPLTCWRQQGELPTMSQKPFWLFWCNDSHSLSSSLLLPFERFVWPPIVLCDRKSADDKVRLYQLLRNSTLGCRCSVDGRQRSQDICQRSQCTDFCNGSIVGCQREQPVDGSRMLATAFLSKPSRGRERNPPPPLLPSHGRHPHNP